MEMRGTARGAVAIFAACVGDQGGNPDGGGVDAGKPQGSEGGPCFSNGTGVRRNGAACEARVDGVATPASSPSDCTQILVNKAKYGL